MDEKKQNLVNEVEEEKLEAVVGGAQGEGTSRTCPHCGAGISAGTLAITCPQCGQSFLDTGIGGGSLGNRFG